MNNINIYDIESEANVIDKINDINSQIEEELDKILKRLIRRKYSNYDTNNLYKV